MILSSAGPSPSAAADRQKALKRERKALYAYLKGLDARDLDGVARAFGLAATAKRRKRRVVAALFEDARVADASASVVRRAAGDARDPASYFLDT